MLASSVQEPARRHARVEVLQDLRALRLAAERRLSRQEQRGRAEHPDEHEPGGGAEEDAAGRVEEAERRQLQPAAEERAGERRERLEKRRAGERADETERTASTASSTRRSADAARGATRVGACDEPAERESARRSSPRRQPAERREDDDRERDPVDGRHGGQCRSTVGASARLQCARPRGRSSAG